MSDTLLACLLFLEQINTYFLKITLCTKAALTWLKSRKWLSTSFMQAFHGLFWLDNMLQIRRITGKEVNNAEIKGSGVTIILWRGAI